MRYNSDMPSPAVDEILRLASRLSPVDKAKLIELLAPKLETTRRVKPREDDDQPPTSDGRPQHIYEPPTEEIPHVEATHPARPSQAPMARSRRS